MITKSAWIAKNADRYKRFSRIYLNLKEIVNPDSIYELEELRKKYFKKIMKKNSAFSKSDIELCKRSLRITKHTLEGTLKQIDDTTKMFDSLYTFKK